MQSRAIFFIQSLLLLLLLADSIKTFAQQPSDTIYFDENWSICEQFVAEYYRVSALNKIDQIFYKGSVRDYYINGQLEMTGDYDSRGRKKGHFTFYNQNGNKAKEGNYDLDRMKGVWNYYDKNGKLKVQFNCTSSANFIPLLIINNKGDTIVKNGIGKFTFNSVTDLPDIFPAAKSYNLTGEVVNGKKEGIFTYSINGSKEGSNFQEYYEDGRFMKALDVNSSFNQNDERSTPYVFLDLQPENLLRIDNFISNNLEFESPKNKEEKLVAFLLLKQIPEIISEATSYDDNTRDIFNIIGTVFRKTIVRTYSQSIGFANPPSAVKSRLLSFSIPADSAAPLAIECTGEFDIDTAGYITKTSFHGNLDVKSIKLINFYLEHLSGLVPFGVNGVKKQSKLVIHFYTLVRSLENDAGKKLVSYSYYGTIENDNNDAAGTGSASRP